jgi:hypothetical protein
MNMNQHPTRSTNRVVAHHWACGDNVPCRTHNGSLYFHGPTLYSYGRHFIAGFRLPISFHVGGPLAPVFLMNADRFSVTTSKHIGIAAGAAARVTSPAQVFSIPDLTNLIRKTNLENGFDGMDSTDRERTIEAIVAHMNFWSLDPSQFINLMQATRALA